MARKPILTDEALDGGLPEASATPPPLPGARDVSATRPVDAPPATQPTRPVAPPPVSEGAGRDASGHARPKTRIHGLTLPVDDTAAATGADPVVPVVGWLVVTAGPGRGAAMELTSGMNAVGRGDENQVQIDFGDDAISRDAHAYVTYDHEARRFHLSHGGKTNLVRLNDAPVLAVEELSHGDTIRIGATALRFVALCGAGFDWSDT